MGGACNHHQWVCFLVVAVDLENLSTGGRRAADRLRSIEVVNKV